MWRPKGQEKKDKIFRAKKGFLVEAVIVWENNLGRVNKLISHSLEGGVFKIKCWQIQVLMGLAFE